MKLTTKIVLGIIISIFLLSFVFIICISFIDKENDMFNPNSRFKSISQENIISVDIEPFKTVFIYEELEQKRRNIFPGGTVTLQPVINENEKNKILLPEELLKFTGITSSNDTLFIWLKMDEVYEQHEESISAIEKRGMAYALDGFNFYLHTNLVDIVCDIDKIKIDIQNIKTDIINVRSFGEISIDSCQANLIETYSRHWKTTLIKNSKVKELSIDLDVIKNWKTEGCEIEILNLTGSGKHSVLFTENTTKVTNWIPKNKEAQLMVTLHGDTARIVFQ